ncbi:S41 family peptidase [Chitinibacter sp. SCUT-21]|uniref:S41 family peptidase n=1 Tax=Chitinibacter sp. SCUT-21 TaxID=2970891 RepID=UPI0035A5C1CB
MGRVTIKKTVTTGISLLASALLIACGGGGGMENSRLLQPDPMNPNGGGSSSDGGSAPTAAVCATNNPYKADAGSTTVGTLKNEKAWVKDYVNSAYLWYQDTPQFDSNAAQFSDESAVYTSLNNYFEALKTPLKTASGAKKDKFSFIYPTKKWEELFSSGTTFNYGIEWKYSSKTAPWSMQVAYVTPNSPAANAGVLRGDTLISIDGLAANGTANETAFNAAMYPSSSAKHAFVFARSGANDISVDITPGSVTAQPVLLSKSIEYEPGKKAGYIVFNEHIATAENQLVSAVKSLKTDNVDTLILDLRYNGGGYLYIASQLAYMIAGDAAANGKVFEQLQYNDKRAADTAKGKSLFETTTCDLKGQSCAKVEPLPSLNLKQVFVIASGDTCSASEAIINGLRGIDVDVQIIGNTTCGKPYGFVGKSNCGISYFPMEFQGVNAKGFGDYADGFSAQCSATDDLSKPLGDTSEGMLAAALYKKTNGSCKTAAAHALTLGNSDEAHLRRPVVLENKFWIAR